MENANRLLVNVPLRRRAALLAALALAACSSGSQGTPSSTPTPTPTPTQAPALQALTLAAGPVFLAVGSAQRLVATGKYSNGSTAAVAGSDLAWASSNPAVATVDAIGALTVVGKGTATISATHRGSGVWSGFELTARAVTAVAYGTADVPRSAHVDTAQAYYKVSGLVPGAFYNIEVEHLDDDVDLAVFSDLSLSDDAELCTSEAVGKAAESCSAPANAVGELYVTVDGEWSEEGSGFQLDVSPAAPVSLAATLAFPGGVPVTGSVGSGELFYVVTGLTPGAAYEVRLSQLTGDADLEVYADRYEFKSACTSYNSGTAAEACVAAANAAGELLVEVDGESTANGSAFKLDVVAK
jgi:hypothetical protein